MLRVLAVDLGASSGRVVATDLDAPGVTHEVVHRFINTPVRHRDGSLRWDWDRLVHEVETGLHTALELGPAASIGVDTWGVDYGLLGPSNPPTLLSPPYCYRDDRTDGWHSVAGRLGSERLYTTTGIQLMGINTVFQLAAHDRSELGRARRVLMLPELLVHALTGAELAERTSAGTTGLVDLATMKWSPPLLDAIGVDPGLLCDIETAGTAAGRWRGVPVHLVGGHDTASAIAALPGPHDPRCAFVSSGTWMLVGAERDEPDVSQAARRANFSNEPGVLGGVRFLRNVMGLWMLEQCVAKWGSSEGLLDAAGALPDGGPVVDATQERFLAPSDMESEVRDAALLPSSAGRDRVARCVLDSLASSASGVLRDLAAIRGTAVSEVRLVGGGVRNAVLNRLLEAACGVPVRTGPAEATALGNALVQGVALGRFGSLRDARDALRT